MPLVALLRLGMLLSLGWIVAAALALSHHGFPWALLLMVLWAALLVRFHRGVVDHARRLAAQKGAAR